MRQLLTAAALLVPTVAVAQDVEEFDHGEIQSTLDYGDGSDKEARFGDFEGLDGYQAFKERLKKDTGLAYMIEYAPISQWGAGAWHMDHELNLIGQWTAFQNEDGDTGQLLGWFQNGATLFGSEDGASFARQLGALSPVNGGTPGDYHNVLQHFAWEQTFDEGRWRAMVGKITSRVTFNTNRYAVSDREDFFTPMIVNNPVATYTARGGVGAFLQHRRESWYASVMVRDADATSRGVDLDTLDSGNWETLAEVALTPELEGRGKGVYRLTWGRTDAIGSGAMRTSSGWSMALSADQDLGEKIGALFRYAWTDEPLRAFESRLALGFHVKGPFKHPDDRWGLGYWTGDPSAPGLRREHGVESFYRMQLAKRVEFTPNVQVIKDPALAPTKDWRTVVGLRLRIVL